MATEITGNTYPVKDQLKALGGRWNPDSKAWVVPDNRADEARRIVAGAGPKSAAPRSSFGGRRSGAYTGRKRGCQCPKPLDEGDGECMLCGYMIR